MNWREWAKKTDRRHILALSGGKDSSALAVYLRDKVPQLEYVFCDTGVELEETHEYLKKIESFLDIKIHTISAAEGFDYYLKMFSGVLPDANTRWCTRMLKLKPYEKFIGNDPVVSYVGIRADEPHRQSYISGKPGVTTVFPFAEDGLVKSDIYRMLEDCGLGLPSYYQWRSRSGCYFCFFQQKREWVGLLENHEDLFNLAQSYTLTASDIEEARRERSALWLADARRKCEHISKLTTEQATGLYAWLQTEPAYLAKQDRATLTQLRDQLRAHLAQQKMEWLLQEFSKLPREQQKCLFERLQLLVNS